MFQRRSMSKAPYRRVKLAKADAVENRSRRTKTRFPKKKEMQPEVTQPFVRRGKAAPQKENNNKKKPIV